MKQYLMLIVCFLLSLLGCGEGNASETSAQGGQGGATSTASAGQGGATHQDGDPCPLQIGSDPCTEYTASFENGVCVQHETPIDGCVPPDPLKNGVGTDASGIVCVPVVPGFTEDGAWARVVFGPWDDTWNLVGLKFLAAEGGGMAPTIPWTLAIGYVPPGLDPSEVNCEVAGPLDVEITGSFQAGAGVAVDELTGHVDAYQQDIGGRIVVCLRETVDADGNGHPTGILMCGEKNSCTDRDQWQTNVAAGSEIQQMSIYGAELCRPWAVELIAE